MPISELYLKENYITPERYVSGRITEYDIKAANINVLLRANLIDQAYYNFLKSLPKHDREVEIGQFHLRMLPKGINVSKVISDELTKYRKMLFEQNQIKDTEVVRIAKDAVFILKSYNLTRLDFDGIIFVPKMVASAMININKVLVFMWYNNQNQIEIDVRGLGSNDQFHQNGMLSIIANVMFMIDKVSIQEALTYLQDMTVRYVNKQLPIEYYREFNSDSSYHLTNTNMYAKFLTENDLDMVDITFNYNVIRELYSIVFGLYNMQRRV